MSTTRRCKCSAAAVGRLQLTGTGDVFAPGDLGQGGADDSMDFATAPGMDETPFDAPRRVRN